jgi:hypothetical protein
MADTSNPAYRHGHDGKGHRSPTYTSWVGMKTRVSNPNRHNSARYVSRGIDMDPRWQDFETFLADMGERPAGTTLEREDNDRGYWPSNCAWATAAQQRRNTAHCVYVDLHGQRLMVIDALAALGRDWRHYRGARWGRKRRTAQEAIDHFVKLATKHPQFTPMPPELEVIDGGRVA